MLHTTKHGKVLPFFSMPGFLPKYSLGVWITYFHSSFPLSIFVAANFLTETCFFGDIPMI
jgi:hypothetical protein